MNWDRYADTTTRMENGGQANSGVNHITYQDAERAGEFTVWTCQE